MVSFRNNVSFAAVTSSIIQIYYPQKVLLFSIPFFTHCLQHYYKCVNVPTVVDCMHELDSSNRVSPTCQTRSLQQSMITWSYILRHNIIMLHHIWCLWISGEACKRKNTTLISLRYTCIKTGFMKTNDLNKLTKQQHYKVQRLTATR